MAAPTRLRGIAIPAEHGGWGFILEPVALGLAVAPSVAGAALGLAALFAFLTRTPLKVTVGDRLRARTRPRTTLADRLTAGYAATTLAALGTAVLLTEDSFWIPLAAALPLIAVHAVYDVRSRGRHLIPELAGPVGVGAAAPAIALAAGEDWALALGMWMVVGLRAAASVLLVRSQLRRAKNQAYRAAPVHAVFVAAATVGILLATFGLLPWLAAVALALLPGFGWWELWRPPVRAVVVGTHQTVLGVAIVVTAAAGFGLG